MRQDSATRAAAAWNAAMSRRAFLHNSGVGAGGVAMALLAADGNRRAAGSEDHGAGPRGAPHFPPKAKRLIYLVMSGGPSQIDLWDYKPALADMFNADLPDSVRMGQRLTTMTSGQKRLPIAPSMFKFAQHGQSGAWVSELIPHTAATVDDLAVVRTMHTEAINHDPAVTFIQTGSQLPGRPSLGAWLSYGLGSECDELPSFIVMTPRWTGRRNAQALFSRLWGSGPLPSKHQGVSFRPKGDPVLFLSDPPGVSRNTRRDMLDGLAAMNQLHYESSGDPEIAARIAQYEMAFRMQTALPDVASLSDETQETLDLYGPEVTEPGTFAASCLLARRLVEKGVRAVQVYHRGWDQHHDLPRDLRNQCRDVDQPCAGLVADLKRRGLLDDTLVVWMGEFGRTVYCQGALRHDDYGRDHHPKCFTAWLAGGGVRAGIVYGETDDFSYNVVRDPVHVNDLNATILHLLGVDHRRLSVKHQGLDIRLTGVEEANVVQQLVL